MIVDCHVHLPSPGLVWEWAPFTADLSACLGYLRRCGVDKAVANSVRAVTAKTSDEVRRGNDEAFAAARDSGGFIVPACIVNPECEGAAGELERCRELGSVWLGEICGYAAGFRYDTKRFRAVVARAVELGMVVQIHATAEEMRDICGRFPRGTFVLPHPASGREDIGPRVEALRDLPNMHLDLCGHGYERMGILELAASIAPERVLFGSDYTINDPAAVIARVRASYLPDGAKDLILGGNAERMLAERGVSPAPERGALP